MLGKNQQLIIVAAVLFCLFLFTFKTASAYNYTYPRLANYYLKWDLNETEARELARWDLLILDMENQYNNPEILQLIRELNPEIIILAYITTQEIIDDVNKVAGLTSARLRSKLRAKIDDTWWLRNINNERISFWPRTYMLNLSEGAGENSQGQKFNDFFPEFIYQEIYLPGYFDGVFYDNAWGDVSWVDANIDILNQGQKLSPQEIDKIWSQGYLKMLNKTRNLVGKDFIIVGNARVFDKYQPYLNGMMLESFPSEWEGQGTWASSIKTYLSLANKNLNPNYSVINVNRKNQTDYQAMRFGLASSLLGPGFYSYDYDVTNHTQTWWYDEYNVNLGPALGPAYNVLELNNSNIKPGLWRRDFLHGSILLNSTQEEQIYIFQQESFDKINGYQDRAVNNGAKINFICLAPEDAVILLTDLNYILDSPFVNGYFYRPYNNQGEQIKNGSFAYTPEAAANSKVFVSYLNNNLDKFNIFSLANGHLSFQKNNTEITHFNPYNNLFPKFVNFAVQQKNNFIEYIVTGPSSGGGPQVQVFRGDGSLISSFFAYDKNNRSGIQVALGDVDGDGDLEIITAPGPGAVPLIKIFTLRGELKYSFLAFDEKFLGGVELVVGDLNNNQRAEIVVAPSSQGGPQVRIFNHEGRPLAQFFAYDEKYRAGLKLSLSDVDFNGDLEILVGIKNPY